MIGYKVAQSGHTRVIVTLGIPKGALTNLGRSSVVNRETAQYRTDNAIVLAIEDETGKRYKTAESSMYKWRSLSYEAGRAVLEPEYTTDPEIVCGRGIHFFLSRRVAEQYRLLRIQNGLLEEWHVDGRKALEVTFVEGLRQGVQRRWHKNGQLQAEVSYKNGKLIGERKEIVTSH
jgi:hypothetical protein